MKPITFYDIPSSVPGKAWSPNAWKTRFCLNYKGLAYETVWVEYPDIEGMSKKMGMKPTGLFDGEPYYTLPAIYDPNTDTALAESALIAEYLDVTYPDTRKLFPPGTYALQHAFIDIFMTLLVPLWQFALPDALPIVTPPSTAYYRRKREQTFGKTLEEMTPKGDAREREWNKVKGAFDTVEKWLEKGKKDGPFLLGEVPGFADFVLAAFILGFRKVWGSDSAQWRDVMSWNEGRWKTYSSTFEKYETIL